MSNIQRLISDKQKYENMFWKKHHECEQLKQILIDNNIRFDASINDSKEKGLKEKGIIIKLSRNLDYGFINTMSESGIFFHISDCDNFILSENMLNKEIEFKLNKENGRVKAVSVSYTPIINVKSNNDLLDILEDYNSSSNNLTTSVKPVETVEKENLEKENLETVDNDIKNIIDKANDVWYMNCHEYSLRYWDKLLEGGFVITWNKENRYRKILDMCKNDIIAWYVRGNGYIAILQVKEKPKMNLTDDDLNFITNNGEIFAIDSKSRERWKSLAIKIHVKFLSVIDKDKCVNHKDIPSIGNWSYGFRGSNCIRPNNDEWSKQVVEMYKYMKNN